MDSMVKTAMAIERERLMTQRASGMLVLVERGRRTSFLLARKISRGLLLHEGSKDRATAPKAKAKISHPKMGGTSGLLARAEGMFLISPSLTL